MNVGELREELRSLPQDKEVWLCTRIQVDRDPVLVFDTVDRVGTDDDGDIVVFGEQA